MMKKFNKKGFTIVELVIVIAVIAILAAVLIPTFSGVVANAEKSAAKNDARAKYQEYVLNHTDSATVSDDFIYKYNDLYAVIKDGQVAEDVYKTKEEAVAAFGTTDVNGTDVPKYEAAEEEEYVVLIEDDEATSENEEEVLTFTGLYKVTLKAD